MFLFLKFATHFNIKVNLEVKRIMDLCFER